LQDENGQVQLTHSVSAGLDYAAVGPEHAWLRDRKRVEYGYATDPQALEAFHPPGAAGGDHSGVGIGARRGRRDRARPENGEGAVDHHQPFRPRRQGRGASGQQD
jgi:hypothetical protein